MEVEGRVSFGSEYSPEKDCKPESCRQDERFE